MHQPEFCEVTICTNSTNLTAAEYVCDSQHLLMGAEGAYRSVRTIPGSPRVADAIVNLVTARAAEYGATVRVHRRKSVQWVKPYSICHEISLILESGE